MSDYDTKCIFISKVYKILLFQLMTMMSFVMISQTSVGKQYFINLLLTMPILSSISSLISELIILNFYDSLSDTWMNIWLSIFTISISNIVAYSTIFFPPTVVLLSLCITIIMVIFLNYHGSTTNYNYSPYYSLLLGALVTMVLSSIGCLWLGIYYDLLIMSLMSAFVFSMFIVMDTQQLTRDMTFVHQHNGHIIVAMTLFLDIVNLFLRILSIVNHFIKKDNKDDKKTKNK